MVRGLDYYMRTTFEVVHGALGAQNSILGGGRYDGLAEALGSKVAAPGIGFSIGEDRVIMAAEGSLPKPVLDLFIAPFGPGADRHCMPIAHDLRKQGFSVEVSVAPKLRRSLELADKSSARFTLIVGSDEMTKGIYSLKDMKTGIQEPVALDQIGQRIK